MKRPPVDHYEIVVTYKDQWTPIVREYFERRDQLDAAIQKHSRDEKVKSLQWRFVQELGQWPL